ncbi:MAG: YceI family protein [Rhodobacteraceae bacterium]|nr:YceI family protein [Paracoccaceae bacterium]
MNEKGLRMAWSHLQRITAAAVLLPTLACALPSYAQDASAVRPKDCALRVTSQYDDCKVDNLYLCSSKEDMYFRIETFAAAGAPSIEILGEDYRPRSFVEPDGGGMSFRQSTSTHPRDVLLSGGGKQTATGTFTMMGMTRPVSLTATLASVGETVQLAGQTFDVIEMQGRVLLPEPVGAVDASVTFGYLPAADVLLEIDVSLSYNGGVVETSRLKAASLANQPGFGSELPLYGCGELSLAPSVADLLVKG